MDFKLRLKVVGLVVYLIYLLILTAKPFDLALSSEVEYELARNVSPLHLLLNVLLFMPFGLLLFFLLSRVKLNDYVKVLICALIGAALSFGIETYQLFLERTSEFSDVVMNTTGSFLGAAVVKIYYAEVVGIIRASWVRIQRSRYLLPLMIALYSAVVFILSVLPIKPVNLHNWNPNFSFQVGNEATLDRPWAGKLYLVAVYDRALSREEIRANFNAGHYPENDGRIGDGLISLYTFAEGSGVTVYDRSGFGSPLDLRIKNPSRARWLDPGALEVLEGTVVKSRNSARKLYLAIKSTDEFSIEVWVAPAGVGQGGPARIVSFARDTEHANFVLGQSDGAVSFRVRTPLSGLSGSDVDLTTEGNVLKTRVQHLVATYKDGMETVFVDGVRRGGKALFNDINLLNFFGHGIAPKVAFCFFFFFPLSFLCYAFFSRRFGATGVSFMLSSLFGFALLVAIESFLAVLFVNKGYDFVLLLLVILVGALTVFFVGPLISAYQIRIRGT